MGKKKKRGSLIYFLSYSAMFLYLTCSPGKVSPFSFPMKFDIFCEYFVFHNCPCSPIQALLGTARTPSHLKIEALSKNFHLCLSPVLYSWRQREWGTLYAWSWGIVVIPIYIVSRTSSVNHYIVSSLYF